MLSLSSYSMPCKFAAIYGKNVFWELNCNEMWISLELKWNSRSICEISPQNIAQCEIILDCYRSELNDFFEWYIIAGNKYKLVFAFCLKAWLWICWNGASWMRGKFHRWRLMMLACIVYTGLILGLRPANERCRYKVTPSLIGWAHP